MSIPALTNYRPIRYSHIPIDPGVSHSLTADPWAYLYSHLLRTGKMRRGINAKNNERARFYAELAKEFYRAAEVVDLPAKATLIYYGMLNLVKCFLSVKGKELEIKTEHHGATVPQGKNDCIKIIPSSNDSISILEEFSCLLGGGKLRQEQVSIKDLFKNLPELHALYSSIFSTEDPTFLRVQIDFCTNETKKQLYTEVSYEKKTEGLVKISRFLKGERKKILEKGKERNGRIYHRSTKLRRPKNWKNVKRSYNHILSEYKKLSICSFLTRSGYQYYVNIYDPKYHHLVYSLMAMFFLGSAARYRPTMMQNLMGGEMRPLITEATALCPKQFQYHLVTLITGQLCAVPFASLE